MIRRATRSDGFTVLQNETLEDDRLSWEALGLLSFLLSKPDDWTVRKDHLISCREAGGHKVKRILSELQEAGYLVRQRTRGDDGQFRWDSVVYDTPRDDDSTIPRKSIDGSPTDGSSIDGKPPDITKKEDNKDGNNKNGESAAPAREDDPQGVEVWTEITGERPNIAIREDLKTAFTGPDAPPWDCEVFRDTLKEAYLNVNQKPHRIRIGYLLSSYRKAINRKRSRGDGAPSRPGGTQFDPSKDQIRFGA